MSGDRITLHKAHGPADAVGKCVAAICAALPGTAIYVYANQDTVAFSQERRDLSTEVGAFKGPHVKPTDVADALIVHWGHE